MTAGECDRFDKDGQTDRAFVLYLVRRHLEVLKSKNIAIR